MMTGRFPRYHYCNEANSNSETVCKHMTCITNQSDTASEKSPDEFDNHYEECNSE